MIITLETKIVNSGWETVDKLIFWEFFGRIKAFIMNKTSKTKQIPLELLAPAKSYLVGKAAIDAGADAVYIGAPHFGARVAVGNSLADIARLVEYAHLFRVRVYVTLNTILFDNELELVQKLIWDLWEIGVDAVIVQDMGILEMDLPPIQLFASTQTHNYSASKVKFLEDVGFKRVILARELSLAQIKNIRKNTQVDLETFVHGALCVSFSGQCYFSQAISGRSGNRGACCQPCRGIYDLVDAQGKILEKQKHLLSLKDFNLSKHLGELVEAGATSFKIEGRLKDVDYVINVVAKYRELLDKIIASDKKFVRASEGKSICIFTPDLDKTFNRGYTNYFFTDRQKDILSPDTAKSIGQKIGEVVSVHKNYFVIDSVQDLQAGDGICFFNSKKELVGTNINRVEGNKIYPNNLEDITKGLEIRRNFSIAFDKISQKEKVCTRLISIKFIFQENKNGFTLTAQDEQGQIAKIILKTEKKLAQNLVRAEETIQNQLSKLGGTNFVAENIEIDWTEPYFLPVSVLNDLRRQVIDRLVEVRQENYLRSENKIKPTNHPYIMKELDYHGNVSNHLAEKFYRRHGVEKIESAFELQKNYNDKEIMTTKHCLRYYQGLCPKDKNSVGKREQIVEPLFLVNGKDKYQLEFDCANCQMKIKKA